MLPILSVSLLGFISEIFIAEASGGPHNVSDRENVCTESERMCPVRMFMFRENVSRLRQELTDAQRSELACAPPVLEISVCARQL